MSSSSSSFPRPYEGAETISPKPVFFELTLEAEGVLHVAINHKKLNPWSDDMTHQFAAIFAYVRYDPEVNVVVLSGKGPAFCAGLDVTSQGLTSLVEDDAARSAFHLKRHIDEFQASISSLETCGKPTIGVAHGICYGLAVDLLCACDIRYADPSARFSIREVAIGLAADIGSLQRLPRIVGNDSLVRELAYTAREFDVQEAKSIGFLSKIVPPTSSPSQPGSGAIAAAIETAKVIAAQSPVAVRSTKANLLYSRDHSVPQGLDYVSTWNAAMLQSQDLPAAMAAALNKQKISFAKL
ncbi:unnamed protein product [Parajaminaea phylloscopi]